MNSEHPVTPTAARTRPAPARPGRFGFVLELIWILLLIVPAATTASSTKDFDANEYELFVCSCWLVVGTRLLWGARGFFLATLPVAILGAFLVSADFLRGANLFALLLQWRTFSATDVIGTARPYVFLATLGCAATASLSWACWRTARNQPTRRVVRWGVLAITAVLALVLPRTSWLRAWPLDGILVVATSVSNSEVMSQYLFPESTTVNPRSPTATWGAARMAGADAQETVVLIIGETVRSDFLQECGGPARVRPAASGALVACDVTSGSDSTVTSVPLLVSREMPGHRARLSDDASVVGALQEAGFEGHWLSTQHRSIAWPDAEHQAYPAGSGLDTALLLPPLAQALARPAPLKAIVLHANNAHEPYCARYNPAQAPYAAECLPLGVLTTVSNLPKVRASYANAVDASIGLVNDVIALLAQHPQPAFLVYTPDHGENLLDDRREIWGHTRRHPTRWDVRVPLVFWANDAWRAAHAAKWARLQSQIGAPLMHVDVVPTLLDAAGVRYVDRRTLPVDLLSQAVPPRRRVVQFALDATTTWDELVSEASAAGPLAK